MLKTLGESVSTGSSPLARGLRLIEVDRSIRERIIPARAGFTGLPSRLYRWRADHPRSRGVYEAEGNEGRRRAGSSPLARGLRGYVQGQVTSDRIIPARAGFTRSDFIVLFTIVGSSPLARGLHNLGAQNLNTARIIPARAGFTLTLPSTSLPNPDHPRSRGVYQGNRPRTAGHAGSSPARAGFTPHGRR